MISNVQTNSNSGMIREMISRYRHLYETSTNRVPHPGDVLYWVGCVGALSALLFVATR